MRVGFIGNKAWLGKTRGSFMHWAGESSTTVVWPQRHSQAVRTQVGVLINILMAFTSVFCSRMVFYSSCSAPPSSGCWEVHPRKKKRECVSLGVFLITDKNCGKSHRWEFFFITQQGLALIFLRNLLLSVSLFTQFNCYDMYTSWNLKFIELGPTSSKWPLIGNLVILELRDVRGSPWPFWESWAFASALKWSNPCS